MHLSESTRRFMPLALLARYNVASAYKWPSPQYDAMERLLYTGGQLNGFAIGGLPARCASRGVPIAAEWLRMAHHDVATHNITDGTGGLDASIYYELDRIENVGAGMLGSKIDFEVASDKYISKADVIALGAIWGVAGCGGPHIPFRGGRIDATGPGRAGVPEPQQDLDSHTESFRLQGFTQSEMIQLVACGHTFGCVRNEDFPDIVDENGTQTTVGVINSFDNTPAFDNRVVTEYLQGTTANPLVVVANTTFQSDLRIFVSDGNQTMQSMKDPSGFSKTCTSVLERMLNTVPAGVQLTEEIKLLPFKVKDARVTIADSQVVLTATIRVITPASEDARGLPPLPAKNITLLWCEKSGPLCTRESAHRETPIRVYNFGGQSPVMDLIKTGFAYYDFKAPLGDASVSKFWFEVTEPGAANSVIEDNGGEGYLLEQDDVLYVPSLSTIKVSFGVDGIPFKFVAAISVRTARSVTQANLKIFDQVLEGPNVPVLSISATEFSVDTTIAPVDGHTFYSANFNAESSAVTVDFDFIVDGKPIGIDFLSGFDLRNVGITLPDDGGGPQQGTSGLIEPTSGPVDGTSGPSEPTSGAEDGNIGLPEPTSGAEDGTIGLPEPTSELSGETEPTSSFAASATGIKRRHYNRENPRRQAKGCPGGY